MTLSLRERLKVRADAFQTLRNYFISQNVLEVDTPILSRGTVPDVHLRSVKAQLTLPGDPEEQMFFLHTSPEYAMKRLLSEGSGDIFYLGKVFRDGDYSPRHEPEFTMLEWYRVHFQLQDMMDETLSLAQQLLGPVSTEKLTYEAAFSRYASLNNVHSQSAEACRECLYAHGVPKVYGVDQDDKPLWEQLIMTEVIEPQLGKEGLVCIYHYPAREAALAKISSQQPEVAERFEMFGFGMELANGYEELQTYEEYLSRFEAELKKREGLQLPKVPLDVPLLAALKKASLPPCSGVALGVDRLIALAQKQTEIQKVIPFSIQDM